MLSVKNFSDGLADKTRLFFCRRIVYNARIGGDKVDFEKFYEEFQTAKAADDFDKMSEIIAQVNRRCNELAAVGRGNEVTPHAIYIATHVNVLIYRVMKLLSDGNAVKATAYLLALAKDNVAGFDKFFHMLYLLGRALYATGNYSQAIKILNRYEKIRSANWGDVDELSLFYRANAFALLGDFDAAIQLYEKILAIKAEFPEARKNLECVLRGDNENLAREIKSLWNFPDWRDVPIFINARDRLGVMKKLIDWLLDAGYRKLIVLDNASTYPLLLEYYSSLERDWRVKVIRLGKNFGYKALWLSNVLERLKIATPYVYTDSDVLPVESCPKDFVKRLIELLNDNRELRKVGLGLVWEDVTFFDKDTTQRTEAEFYAGTKVGENLYHTQLDTTFALYPNVRHYSLRFSLRTTGDLRAYHLPWYFDYDNLPADERYYLEHADKNSVTSVKNFYGGNDYLDSIKIRGGNLRLHPVDAPQLVNDLNVVAAPERNAAHC